MQPAVNPHDPASASLADHFRRIARGRRSVYSYLDAAVPRELIDQAIADALVSPNHHRTRPWRFLVVPREARGRLVEAYESAAARLGRDVARARQRAQDAPVNVVVWCKPDTANPRVQAREEEFAVAAAIQTFLLSLSACGVDTLLTTGDLAESPEVAALAGVNGPGARVMAVVNCGYRNPARPVAPRQEPVPGDVASWLGSA